MSLITRCPACTTLFKVVQDQLRISEGWVRCGQCDTVFDATVHLQDPALSSEQEERGVETAAPPEAPQAHEIPVELNDVPTPHEVLLAPSVDSDVASREDVPEALDELVVHAPVGLSFMKKSPQAAGRYGVLVTVFLWGGFVVLAGLLSLQIIIHERNRIAAAQPDLRPVLVSLCDVLECKLEPLRQIESVVIESSSFVNVRGGVYRLSLTLKNNAAVEVAVPALELSLTDLQDQAVIRRVVATHEMGPTPPTLLPGAEMQVMVPISVKSLAAADKFSGYRLLIFYP